MKALASSAALFLAILTNCTSFAAFGDQLFKLLPSDGAANDRFGSSVAVSGNTAIVGAYRDDHGISSGSAYLFDVRSSEELFKLTPEFGEEFNAFGWSSDISGNIAIVGAYGYGRDFISPGSAYLFDVTTGKQLFKLLPEDGSAEDHFGFSVGISGNIAIVGAYEDDANGNSSGSAYLFDVATGSQIAKLIPEDAAAGLYFGRSVAISGNTAIIGAGRGFLSPSTAYLFDTTLFTQVAKLEPNGVMFDRIGPAVAIDGATAIVGVDGFSFDSFLPGEAHVFNTLTGSEQTQLTPGEGEPSRLFGYSVDIRKNTAVVGAVSSPYGRAYLFDVMTGEQLAKFIPTDTKYASLFGWSVGIDDSTVVVGDSSDLENGVASGAAYIFSTVPEPATMWLCVMASAIFTKRRCF